MLNFSLVLGLGVRVHQYLTTWGWDSTVNHLSPGVALCCFIMPHINFKPSNFWNSAPKYCLSLWVSGRGGGLSADGVADESTEGAEPPDSLILHVGIVVPCCLSYSSFQASVWLGVVLHARLLVSVWGFKRVCMCVFGQPARSDVAMEEVCCRFVRRSRRTSSLTLTLPRSKLVRPENWRFGFLLAEEAPDGFLHKPRKWIWSWSITFETFPILCFINQGVKPGLELWLTCLYTLGKGALTVWIMACT